MTRHLSYRQFATVALGVFVAINVCARLASAQYTFATQPDLDGDWADSASWLDGGNPATDFPNAPDATALFDMPLTSSPTTAGGFTIYLPSDRDITVGSLTIDNTGFTFSYNNRITSNGHNLIFQSTSGPATYTETAGNTPANPDNAARFQMLTPVELLSDLILTQDNRSDQNTSSQWTQLVNAAENITLYKEGIANVVFSYNAPLGASEGFKGKYVINGGGIGIQASQAIQKATGIEVNPGGQLQIAAGVGNSALATGATLNLNGDGKEGGSASQGALRFQIANGTTANFNSPVVLESDTVISAAAPNTTGVLTQAVTGPGGLTKHGNGTLRLTSADNAYEGDTRVLTAGNAAGLSVLSITTPFLADLSDVYLSATRTALNLDFTGTDSIRSFFINDVAQPIGIYGALDNLDVDEAFRIPLITGTGMLEVTAIPPTDLPGDFNHDNAVDAADYVIWRKTLGDPPSYQEWATHFGESNAGAGGGNGTVPEPATCMSLLIAASLCASSRRR